MKDLLRLYCNKNNPERPEIVLGKKMTIDWIARYSYTGLYDHRMINDEQTSNLSNN